jgi:hypothetical protein
MAKIRYNVSSRKSKISGGIFNKKALVAVSYAIGDTGPGGGVVFYDAGSTLSWGRYLEVATTSSSPAWTDVMSAWSGNTNTIVGTSTAIGTGYANTLAMVAQSNQVNRAGTRTRSYSGGGKSDWFLPSKDELNQLWINRSYVSGIDPVAQGLSAYRVSSSETTLYPATNVFATFWPNGNQGSSGEGKSGNLTVRPIRAF